MRYGADFQELLDVNDLTIENSQNLQIGDILVVPLEGCVEEVAVDDTAAQESVAAEQAAIEPTSTPVRAQFEIVAVEGLGDITAESIRLRNIGDRVNMTNWTLSDSEGNSFLFPITMRFPQDEIVIYTRTGTSTCGCAILGQGRKRMGRRRGADFARRTGSCAAHFGNSSDCRRRVVPGKLSEDLLL